MKYSARLWSVAVGALGLALVTAATQAGSGRAVVASVSGSADCSTAEGWKAVQPNTVLTAGSVIRTQGDASVVLMLDMAGRVMVTENSELGVDALESESTGAGSVITVRLDLRSGRIVGYVPKSSEASVYEVKTPQGSVLVKSGEYEITAMAGVSMASGRSVLNYKDAQGRAASQVINTGETFMPSLAAPKPIEPADLDRILADVNKTKTVSGGGLVAVVQPTEPFVSAIVGSASSSKKSD